MLKATVKVKLVKVKLVVPIILMGLAILGGFPNAHSQSESGAQTRAARALSILV